MPKPAYQKITKRFVDGVEVPKSGQTFYNDSELRGFKLRVNATGIKVNIPRKPGSRSKRNWAASPRKAGDLSVGFRGDETLALNFPS